MSRLCSDVFEKQKNYHKKDLIYSWNDSRDTFVGFANGFNKLRQLNIWGFFNCLYIFVFIKKTDSNIEDIIEDIEDSIEDIEDIIYSREQRC